MRFVKFEIGNTEEERLARRRGTVTSGSGSTLLRRAICKYRGVNRTIVVSRFKMMVVREARIHSAPTEVPRRW
jgi:hypothetical protein